MSKTIVSVRNLSKRFDGVVAVDRISFDLCRDLSDPLDVDATLIVTISEVEWLF